MKKILWFDCETGGTDPKNDALIQLSALIEIGGKVVDQIDLKMKPLPKKNISHEAIEKHGMTLQDIAGFMHPHDAYDKFYKFLAGHGPKSKTDRYIMAGYNPQFDCDFVSQWFADVTGGPYAYWDYLQFSPLDVLPTLRAMRLAGIIDTPDTKLETMCKHFGIEIKAHDAMSDILATRELTHKVYGDLFTSYNGTSWGILGAGYAAS